MDIGSGGEVNHPAAVVFIAVRPDMRFGRVMRGWRGDGVVTESGDILRKFIEIRGAWRCVDQVYDWHAKDFKIVADRSGESFNKAEKGHEIGEDNINTLFKHNMLVIDDVEGDIELDKLAVELQYLLVDTPKSKAHDDFSDALRYTVCAIPWDFSAIQGDLSEEELEEQRIREETRPLTEKERVALEIKERRGEHGRKEGETIAWGELDEELDFWNRQYG